MSQETSLCQNEPGATHIYVIHGSCSNCGRLGAIHEPPPPYQAEPVSIPALRATIVVSKPFGKIPMQMHCPFCQAGITTATELVVGRCTVFMCVVLCIFGGILGLVPFCGDSCRDVIHTCPCCHEQVGHYDRLKEKLR